MAQRSPATYKRILRKVGSDLLPAEVLGSLKKPLPETTGHTKEVTTGSSKWINAAKFLTGASTMGSIAIPVILRHAHLIETGAMFIEFTSFFILVVTVLCFHRVSLDEDW